VGSKSHIGKASFRRMVAHCKVYGRCAVSEVGKTVRHGTKRHSSRWTGSSGEAVLPTCTGMWSKVMMSCLSERDETRSRLCHLCLLEMRNYFDTQNVYRGTLQRHGNVTVYYRSISSRSVTEDFGRLQSTNNRITMYRHAYRAKR